MYGSVGIMRDELAAARHAAQMLQLGSDFGTAAALRVCKSADRLMHRAVRNGRQDQCIHCLVTVTQHCQNASALDVDVEVCGIEVESFLCLSERFVVAVGIVEKRDHSRVEEQREGLDCQRFATFA